MMRKLFYFFGFIFLFAGLVAMCSDSETKDSNSLVKTEKAEEKPLSEAELKKLAATREAEKLEARKAYKEALRNNFLDSGLDIEVNVQGKAKDHLHLQYALFNDVWTRKFETSGNADQWHEMGFKKVTISDGYDYNMVITWTN